MLKEDDTAELYEFDSSNNAVWRKSMKGFRRHVRIRKAEATITITESEYYAFPPWENDKPVAKMRETPRWLSEAVAKDLGHCICMTIDVPGQRPTIVMVPYSETESGGVKFEEPDEGPEDFKGPRPPMSREAEGATN